MPEKQLDGQVPTDHKQQTEQLVSWIGRYLSILEMAQAGKLAVMHSYKFHSLIKFLFVNEISLSVSFSHKHNIIFTGASFCSLQKFILPEGSVHKFVDCFHTAFWDFTKQRDQLGFSIYSVADILTPSSPTGTQTHTDNLTFSSVWFLKDNGISLSPDLLQPIPLMEFDCEVMLTSRTARVLLDPGIVPDSFKAVSKVLSTWLESSLSYCLY